MSITARLAEVKEDLRRDYLWDPGTAAAACHLHPNKFGTWWYATRGKLIELFVSMPGETAAELAMVLAIAEQERQSRSAATLLLRPLSPLSESP